MTSVFDEEQVRAHWCLLGHRRWGVTELFVVRPGRPALAGFFDDEDNFVDTCREWSGRFNIYVGVHPRSLTLTTLAHNELKVTGRRGRRADITRVTLLFYDLDVETDDRNAVATESPDGKAPSTDHEVESAVDATRTIASDDLFESPVLAVSGNGAYVLAPVDLEVTEVVESQLQALEEQLRQRYADNLAPNHLKLDSVYDLPRVMAVMGTQKVKGLHTAERPHRMACFLDDLPERRTNEKLGRHIVSLPGIPTKQSAPSGPVNVSIGDELEPLPGLCGSWNRIYVGVEKDDSGRRHPVLLWLTAAMIEAGFSHDSIHQAILLHDAHLGGKMAEHGHDPQTFTDRLIRVASQQDTRHLCGIARRILGDDHPCDDCDERDRSVEYHGKRYRRAPATSEDVRPRVEPVANDEIPDQWTAENIAIRNRFLSAMTLEQARMLTQHLYLCESYLREGRRAPPALLIKAPPGLGKTYLALQSLAIDAAKRAREDPPVQPLRFIFLVDRHDRQDEVLEELRGIPGGEELAEQIVLIRGKVAYRDGKVDPGASLCTRAREVAHFRDRNYGNTEYTLTCGACRPCIRQDCPYLRQFDATDRPWLMTLDYVFTERIRRANDPEVVVCDESLLGRIRKRKIEVRPSDLERTREVLQEEGYEREELSVLLDHLEKAMGEKAMSGVALRLYLASLEPRIREVVHGLREQQELSEALLRAPRSDRRQSTTLPVSFLPDLLRILDEEHAAEAANSRLSIEKGNLVIREPSRPLLSGDVPMIVLDATGDPELYEHVLSREVEVVESPVPVQVQSVYQLASGSYPKSSLRRPRERERLFRLVRAIVEAFNDESIGIVTFKDLVRPLREHLEELGQGIQIAHFWGLRGTNELRGVDNLIVLGTPTENVTEMEVWASALYWDQEELDLTPSESWDRLGVDPRTNEKVEVLIKHFLDHRLEQLLWQGREAEFLQAVFRIRPLDDPDKRKAIFLLANTPVPRLEPNVIVDSVGKFMTELGVGRPRSPKDDLRDFLRDALGRGEAHTIRELMEKFGVSRSTVIRTRNEVKKESS